MYFLTLNLLKFFDALYVFVIKFTWFDVFVTDFMSFAVEQDYN